MPQEAEATTDAGNYAQAETIIEEARKTQSAVLDLSGLRLTTLPASLGNLTELQSLKLNRNGLRTLPDWLGNLTQLEDLSLKSNGLRTLPDWLGNLTQLQYLFLSGNGLTTLPDWLANLAQLRYLDLSGNGLTALPASLGNLTQLQNLYLGGNSLTILPESLGNLTQLQYLVLSDNDLTVLPASLGNLTQLQNLFLGGNGLATLPDWLTNLPQLLRLNLDNNPLAPELQAAYEEGLLALQKCLRAQAAASVELYEAKLILVGEGEVGKSCLLAALRGDAWVEARPTTHGIEIKPVGVTDPETGTPITLNGWDFGGQRVYRPTHQLFFSAPAVYLVVWKPREGPQQGFVKEWIKLIKHREPDAKVLVVATHGGPRERQPDIDRQELWDLFGRDTIAGFHFVDSMPNQETGEGHGVADLREVIARVAANLPEMGRRVPARWMEARADLKATGLPYLPLEQVLQTCRNHKMDDAEAQLFIAIAHRLGHLIHYAHDPALRDIVILKPDWLTTAISYVLDDKVTRDSHGLVSLSRLSDLWNDPERDPECRYAPELHPIFLRLMERFDLSYEVAGVPARGPSDKVSLVAQLVPDVRPELSGIWPDAVVAADEQQIQICRITDTKTGQTASAEGLFYQLIVRLHRYSLGRRNYAESVHWQRGLLLDDDYNGRALLEHVGNDVRITVRAAYPQSFLSVLTHEVKWLVESFWQGLRCDVTVPCAEPCGKGAPGTCLFELQKLIAFKKQGLTRFPCTTSDCNTLQDIGCLLLNASSSEGPPRHEVLEGLVEVKGELAGVRDQLKAEHGEVIGRFDNIDVATQRLLSMVDDSFNRLMRTLTDEAKDGPRLFSFEPIDPGFFDKPSWISQKFRLTLWCEHSRLPLPALNPDGDRSGVYDLDLPREWLVKSAPAIKVLSATLSLVLPVASSATKLLMDDTAYKNIERQLELSQKSMEFVLKGEEKTIDYLTHKDSPDSERRDPAEAHGAFLRQLHALLKEKDPSFGGLVRVQNKQQEFLWVHPKWEYKY